MPEGFYNHFADEKRFIFDAYNHPKFKYLPFCSPLIFEFQAPSLDSQ